MAADHDRLLLLAALAVPAADIPATGEPLTTTVCPGLYSLTVKPSWSTGSNCPSSCTVLRLNASFTAFSCILLLISRSFSSLPLKTSVTLFSTSIKLYLLEPWWTGASAAGASRSILVLGVQLALPPDCMPQYPSGAMRNIGTTSLHSCTALGMALARNAECTCRRSTAAQTGAPEAPAGLKRTTVRGTALTWHCVCLATPAWYLKESMIAVGL